MPISRYHNKSQYVTCIISVMYIFFLHKKRPFMTLLITGDHSDSILTPSTPPTHYPRPCQEERGNLIYFYNQVYTIKMQHFAERFAPTSGVSEPFQVCETQIHNRVNCCNMLPSLHLSKRASLCHSCAGRQASFVSIPPAVESISGQTQAVQQPLHLHFIVQHRHHSPPDTRTLLLLQLKPGRGLWTEHWKPSQ